MGHNREQMDLWWKLGSDVKEGEVDAEGRVSSKAKFSLYGESQVHTHIHTITITPDFSVLLVVQKAKHS